MERNPEEVIERRDLIRGVDALQQDRQCTVEARSRNHFCSGKALSIAYSECAVQCTGAILSYVAWSALQYFSTLPQKRNNFRKKKSYTQKLRVFILSTTFV